MRKLNLTEQERAERAEALKKYKREWAKQNRITNPTAKARLAESNRKQREKRRLLNPLKPKQRMPEAERIERRRASLKKYNLKNKANLRAYYLENAEKLKQRSRERGKTEAAKAMTRERTARKKETDENFRILCKLRSSIGSTIKRYTGRQKADKTTALIGCSIEFFRGWIESKFKPGMTWANHGKMTWHIDHRIPCAEFDLRDPEQQKQCFNYTNLQPLWALDNLRKSDKLIYEPINPPPSEN